MDKLTQLSTFVLQLRTSVILRLCSKTRNKQTFFNDKGQQLDKSYMNYIKKFPPEKLSNVYFFPVKSSIVKYNSYKTLLDTSRNSFVL